ncbi:hypothetical protein HMPREF2806_09605 [Corynebacterium sp. HMSC076G08]|uniref:hypothetical protein n=1 Tax=Corynebacterium sp. HMSC076G08 TaxID=1739310 RepID=UPI0008A47674|nr:hypothetical protein [Corynebacterium sp. HMSC076G08]OFK66596.1 hypothetical protein HMPREF2806_09605 [Corynebacterium sp. HMSC076G08]
MALRLVKPGPVVLEYDKAVGGVTSSGWQTVTFGGQVYQTLPAGVWSVTVTGVDCDGVRLYYRRAASPSVNAFFLESAPVTSLQAPTVTATLRINTGDRFFMQVNGEKPETTLRYSATYLTPI